MQPGSTPTDRPARGFEGVTLYHWLVVIIASCGWLFDCMDQALFSLSREWALKELLAGNAEALKNVTRYGGYATNPRPVSWKYR